MTVNTKQPEKYVIFSQSIEDGEFAEPLAIDRKGNYDVLLAVIESSSDKRVYKKYEQVNQNQWNLVQNFLRIPKEERKDPSEGLIKQMDELQGVLA